MSGHIVDSKDDSERLVQYCPDQDLDVLHQAALKAEEAAARILQHAKALEIPYSGALSLPGPRNQWLVPLTPDDSSEESAVRTKSEVPGTYFVSGTANISTGQTEQIALSSTDIVTPKKRGRPPKQNFIDSIVGDNQQVDSTSPRRRGRPPGSTASKPKRASQLPNFGGFSTQIPPPSSRRPTTTSSIASSLLDSSSMTELEIVRENNLLKAIFKSEIGPIMDETMGLFESKLPRETLISVGRAFADEILNHKLRRDVRKGHYIVTPIFKQIAAGTVHRMLLQKMKDHGGSLSGGAFYGLSDFERTQTNSPSARDSREKIQRNHSSGNNGVPIANLNLHLQTKAVFSEKQVNDRALRTREGSQNLYTPLEDDGGMGRYLVRHPEYVARDAVTQDPIRKLTHYVPRPRTRNVASVLRNREIGFGKWRGPEVDIRGMKGILEANLAENLRCWRSWSGASKDVVTAAWAPSGSMYAIGASTDMDNMNLQYNRANNLLLGNCEANTLTELPDHFIERPRPETIETGDNSLEATYNAVDPELYATVSHVCFGPEGDRMYSASFDKTVKVWDLSATRQPTCVETIRHDAKVELLAISTLPQKLLATGQRTYDSSIQVYGLESDTSEGRKLVSERGAVFGSSRPRKLELNPTCLLWGPTNRTSHFLLAGFAENRSDDFGREQEGDLCLWNVETQTSVKLTPSSQAVHDISWHPTLPIFAAGTAPGSRSGLSDRRTRSVIRTYEPVNGPGRIMEYECPALDINDIRFHPFDNHYISAGCTDGATYVWDARMPDLILHRLLHGKPIDELDWTLPREEQDTGVRFTAWDKHGLNLLTGGSDGKIKCWNIFSNTEDAFVRDIAHFDSGIMTGSFSPDHSNLLVGLSKGAVHILSTAPLTHDSTEDLYASRSSTPSQAYDAINHIPFARSVADDPATGTDIANYLVASEQITMHPTFGAGKGPNYKGPFASYARREGADPATDDLNPDILASQLDRLERRRGRKLGGKPDKALQLRYREATKVAHERNYLPYQFKEEKRKAKKRIAEVVEKKLEGARWDGKDDEEEEVSPVAETQSGKEETPYISSAHATCAIRDTKRTKGIAEWTSKEIVVIDDD